MVSTGTPVRWFPRIRSCHMGPPPPIGQNLHVPSSMRDQILVKMLYVSPEPFPTHADMTLVHHEHITCFPNLFHTQLREDETFIETLLGEW
jgi:hypothetical protein